jgi:carboxypeptidase T
MKFNFKFLFAIAALVLIFLPAQKAETTSSTQYWMKIHATDKFQRSVIANIGVSIEKIEEDYVVATGNLEEMKAVEKLGWMDVSFALTEAMDFPEADAEYHNYKELMAALVQLKETYPTLTDLYPIGKTVEGRDIYRLRISGDLAHADTKPGIIFMGGHHSREHLSVEMPLRLAKYLLSEYAAGNARIKGLIDNRDIHIIPAVNPDGLEYDIATGKYQMWRKNRRQNENGTFGVDLNRNYGFQWGTGGSSASPNSDTYKGPTPFSEPETMAIRDYIEEHVNITTLLSFHTFSKLILYPWGHSNNPIGEQKDMLVHKTMAETMAKWNGYTPEQASDLYIASGDTTDWAYGQHKIISFTFELDPANTGFGGGGFYPGAKIIDEVVRKNIEPSLYLIEYADDPYRVLKPSPR